MKYGSNIFSICSSVIPQPVSETLNAAYSPSMYEVMVIRFSLAQESLVVSAFPSMACMAFFTRLRTTCFMSAGSIMTFGMDVASLRSREMPFPSSSGATTFATLSTMSLRLIFSRFTFIGFTAKRKSTAIAFILSTSSFTTDRYLSAVALSTEPFLDSSLSKS